MAAERAPELEVFAARPGDAAVIAEIAALTLPERWTESVVRKRLHQPVSRARVVWRGGRALGFVLATRVLDEGEIQALAVRPDAQGQGVGRVLLSAFLAAERAAGVKRVSLDVRAGNAAAQALYRACGFEPCGERPRYYRDGEAALVMSAGL